MIPISKMDLDLEDFLNQENSGPNPCTKCAYVIPTYEIAVNSSRLPINKTDLMSFIKVKIKHCITNPASTGLLVD